MPAFNPPNPYGSYFNFGSTFAGDPTPELWRNPNYPNLSIPTSQGVASAMGSPSGGINPTQQEFLESRRRDIAYQQFIDRAVKEDARTRTIGNMVMQGIYGNDARGRAGALARIGGADAYNGIIGTLINTPGISGYLGGSVRSLAVGSLAAATSGLTMNGYGVFGDKGMNLRFADNLMSSVSNRFYGANGNPILSMTNGLNRDQMGGVMVQAASQGAFSGLDMGSFQKLDSAGRRAKFIANDGTTQKITDFLKDTTKALSSLIDVYGNISSGELMQKAQEITGLDLSRLGNAKIMGDRLQKLRDTARMTGIDTQSMFDMAGRVGGYATGIGATASFAGTVGVLGASQGMMEYRMRQLNTHGFFAPSMTPVEAGMAVARDTVAMSRDPLGSRMAALEMLIRDSGATDGAALRSAASGFGATSSGVAGLEKLARDRFGVSLTSTIRSFGGADNLMRSLDPEAQANVYGMLNSNFGGRQSKLLRSMMGRLNGLGSNSQIDALHKVVSTFDNDTIEGLLNGSGNIDSALALVAGSGDVAGKASLRQAIATARGMGSTAYHLTRDMMQSSPLLSRFASTEARNRNALMLMGGTSLPDDFRGNMLGGGFAAGMLDKATGNDPMSQLQWMMAVRPELVGGVKEAVNFNANAFTLPGGGVDMKAWAANMMNFKAGLGRTAAGRAIIAKYHLGILGPQYDPNSKGTVTDMLLNMHDVMKDGASLQELMSPFAMYSHANGRSLFVSKQDLEAKSAYGDSALFYRNLADSEAASGVSSSVVGAHRQIAQALINGGIFRATNGVLSGHSVGVITRGEANAFASDKAKAHAVMQAMTDPNFKMNSAMLSQFQGTAAGSELARQLKDQLSIYNTAIDTEPNSLEKLFGVRSKYGAKKDKIQAMLDQLGATGATARRDSENLDVQKITGSLILTGVDGKPMGTATFSPDTRSTSGAVTK